jgi:hypothetical protein
MKEKYVLVLIRISAVLISGCTQSGNPPVEKAAVSADYFPAKEGMSWSYKIDLGTKDPMLYQEMNGRFYWARINAKELGNDPDCCRLSFVAQDLHAVSSGNIQIYRLSATRDDLGILGISSESKWSVLDKNGKLEVFGTFSYPFTFEEAGKENGSEEKLALFGFKPVFFTPDRGGEEKSYAGDTLKFIAYEKETPGYEGSSVMHFARRIDALNLSEDTWYVPKKGLVKFEQRVSGELSMTWTLESFNE